jgi:hypothetical protein
MVVENMGSGGAVLTNLQHHLFYDNIYYENAVAKIPKAGLKVSLNNRLMILEALQRHCINGTIKINSRRLVQEITTFAHNPQTGKIAANKGEHDDAILGASLALFVRDSILRDLPLGSGVPKEFTETIKSTSYEEIKREIMDGSDKFEENEKLINSMQSVDEEMAAGVAFDFRRKFDKLLSEFGW